MKKIFTRSLKDMAFGAKTKSIMKNVLFAGAGRLPVKGDTIAA